MWKKDKKQFITNKKGFLIIIEINTIKIKISIKILRRIGK